MNAWQVVADASIVVQLVLVLLVLASLVSWAVIFAKMRAFARAKKADARFLEAFSQASGIGELLERAQSNAHGALSAAFIAGVQEYRRQQGQHRDARFVLDAVSRAASAAAMGRLAQLGEGLITLAAISSSAPFVGLFGTVWGIMETFHRIGKVQTATLATVAPGIAEALIATAMGLFAAIPAVFAYNRFTAALDARMNMAERFQAELLNLLARHWKG